MKMHLLEQSCGLLFESFFVVQHCAPINACVDEVCVSQVLFWNSFNGVLEQLEEDLVSSEHHTSSDNVPCLICTLPLA